MKKTDLHAHMRRELKDKSLLEQARAYSFDYIDTVADRTVYPDATAMEHLDRFDGLRPILM